MQNNFHPEIAYQSQTQCLDAYADVLHAANAAQPSDAYTIQVVVLRIEYAAQ